MTLQAAVQKTFYPFFLIVAFSLPSVLRAQHFEIDATDFFNDNKGEVTHPRSVSKAGPKADFEPAYKQKSTEKIIVNPEEVPIADVHAAVANKSKKSSVVSEDPLPASAYGSNWDTLNVRVRRTDFSSKSDTSYITLANIQGSAFVFPFKGKMLSPFGYRGRHFHAGVDIKLNHGDTIVCAFDGIVRMAKNYGGYGNAVVVRHSNGLETLYGHLSKIRVHVNQELKAGDLIGLGGRTGRATCNHLHFETRYLGEAFNPRQFIDLDTYCLTKEILPITSRTFGRATDYLPSALNTGFEEEAITSASKTSKSSHSRHGKTKDRKYHSIKNGETLYSIATRNHTTVKDLCSLNRIGKNKTLKIGTRLRLK
jgi:murein DD-endopeptidase MepM/ murein hydrolase activator NlpD